MLKDNEINVTLLKKICKYRKIHRYSTIKKIDLLQIVNKCLSSLRIQRFLRRKWIRNNKCPISLEDVKFPCFPFKPKGSTNFIYYNLEYLINYLIVTGDFRDAKTREPYNAQVLKNIDKISKGLYGKSKYKSVYKASKNKKKYRRKTSIEDDVLVLERCMDDLVASMITSVENSITMTDDEIIRQRVSLECFHYPSFRNYHYQMYHKNAESSKIYMEQTIEKIKRFKVKDFRAEDLYKDHLLNFMMSLKFQYY